MIACLLSGDSMEENLLTKVLLMGMDPNLDPLCLQVERIGLESPISPVHRLNSVRRVRVKEIMHYSMNIPTCKCTNPPQSGMDFEMAMRPASAMLLPVRSMRRRTRGESPRISASAMAPWQARPQFARPR